MTTTAAEPAASDADTDSLAVTDLTVHYGGVCAVRSVALSVAPGESMGIIGSNGAGKTSTLKALMGLVPRTSGRITLGDTDLSKVRARDMVRHGVGYVPEGRHVFPGLSVEKNLMLGAYHRPWKGETRDILAHVFDLFPVLRDFRSRAAGDLSGGQQQMLAIGRALMSKPRLLLLDEPSMGLSPKLIENVLEILVRLRGEGLGLLLVEQNAKLTFGVTSHCLVMENGSVAMSGTSEELAHDERVRQIYLGL
ncbi:ABC transporter ATP-binding protein [Streptomyces sp. NPDC005302]|uniref:ABC transporter ATP-binding protein n=1 Tax=Streptomyces sp. NPDC005302 TaxID=3154675 RepID=UPI0033ADD451